MGRPARLPEFCRVVALSGLLSYPDRFSHRVEPLGQSGFNNNDFYDDGRDMRQAIVS